MIGRRSKTFASAGICAHRWRRDSVDGGAALVGGGRSSTGMQSVWDLHGRGGRTRVEKRWGLAIGV